MTTIVGEVTAQGVKAQIEEAIENAIRRTPAPPLGHDIQHFRVVSVELEYGGFVGATKTRVTLDYEPGPLSQTAATEGQ